MLFVNRAHVVMITMACLFALAVGDGASAAPLDPQDILGQIRTARADPESAVKVTGFRLRTGLAIVHLDHSVGYETAQCRMEELIIGGVAYADLRFAHSAYDEYVGLQEEAIAGKVGLWKNVTREQLPKWLQREMPELLNSE